MKIFLLLALVPTLAHSTTLPPATTPIFLKLGFSSVLEFNDLPTRVVLGDAESFQVEKLEKSLVIRTTVSYATSNMFVYFKNEPTKLIILTASDDAEPTYFKRFETISAVKPQTVYKPLVRAPIVIGAKSTSTQFDSKGDYLSIDIEISADSKTLIKPKWDSVRLLHNSKEIKPIKLWSQRKEVQRDSRVRARFIFLKPDVPKDLKSVALSIPREETNKPFLINLKSNGGK